MEFIDILRIQLEGNKWYWFRVILTDRECTSEELLLENRYHCSKDGIIDIHDRVRVTTGSRATEVKKITTLRLEIWEDIMSASNSEGLLQFIACSIAVLDDWKREDNSVRTYILQKQRTSVCGNYFEGLTVQRNSSSSLYCVQLQAHFSIPQQSAISIAGIIQTPKHYHCNGDFQFYYPSDLLQESSIVKSSSITAITTYNDVDKLLQLIPIMLYANAKPEPLVIEDVNPAPLHLPRTILQLAIQYVSHCVKVLESSSKFLENRRAMLLRKCQTLYKKKEKLKNQSVLLQVELNNLSYPIDWMTQLSEKLGSPCLGHMSTIECCDIHGKGK